MNINKLEGIRWVRAHVKKGEEHTAGITPADRYGNACADALATEGVRRHNDDGSAVAACVSRIRIVTKIQKALLERHKQLVQKKLVTYDEQESEVVRRHQGGKMEHIVRESVDHMQEHQSKHEIVRGGGYEICLRCGRHSSLQAKRQARLQKWREECVPLKSHRAAIDMGHVLTYDGGLKCAICGRDGQQLRRARCEAPRRFRRDIAVVDTGGPVGPQPAPGEERGGIRRAIAEVDAGGSVDPHPASDEVHN